MEFTTPLTPEQHTAIEEYFADWQHGRKHLAVEALKNCNYPADILAADAQDLVMMDHNDPTRAEMYGRFEKDNLEALFQGPERKVPNKKKLVQGIVQYAPQDSSD